MPAYHFLKQRFHEEAFLTANYSSMDAPKQRFPEEPWLRQAVDQDDPCSTWEYVEPPENSISGLRFDYYSYRQGKLPGESDLPGGINRSLDFAWNLHVDISAEA
ncbi:hypothetical protein CALVIDRAFT_538204 [Calocera viscosa TUFC12733]|uniref:Uncharacterized protein n=1 Tax=Calocera viscosa (strain TUFC12733) TaxID=1330018 RepID=A0A167L898_CALVF|nr:hypothetical protein CALVIDRAFT_538204 [Calocera viscosa TUFC12733]